MTGDSQKVPMLRGTGLEGDAELGAMVRTVNQLAACVRGRTPLGTASGKVKGSKNGYLLGGKAGGGGSGGGLPPFYASGSGGMVRVNWGVVYHGGSIARVPVMEGQDLREGPTLRVPTNGNGWVVLRVKVRWVWLEVEASTYSVTTSYRYVPAPSGPGLGSCEPNNEERTSPAYEAASDYTFGDGEDGVEVVWVSGDRPDAQEHVGKTLTYINVAIAEVVGGRVRAIVQNDVGMTVDTTASGSLAPTVFPIRPEVTVTLSGWFRDRQPEDFE
jgi:hypothetical protein